MYARIAAVGISAARHAAANAHRARPLIKPAAKIAATIAATTVIANAASEVGEALSHGRDRSVKKYQAERDARNHARNNPRPTAVPDEPLVDKAPRAAKDTAHALKDTLKASGTKIKNTTPAQVGRFIKASVKQAARTTATVAKAAPRVVITVVSRAARYTARVIVLAICLIVGSLLTIVGVALGVINSLLDITVGLIVGAVLAAITWILVRPFSTKDVTGFKTRAAFTAPARVFGVIRDGIDGLFGRPARRLFNTYRVAKSLTRATVDPTVDAPATTEEPTVAETATAPEATAPEAAKTVLELNQQFLDAPMLHGAKFFRAYKDVITDWSVLRKHFVEHMTPTGRSQVVMGRPSKKKGDQFFQVPEAQRILALRGFDQARAEAVAAA